MQNDSLLFDENSSVGQIDEYKESLIGGLMDNDTSSSNEESLLSDDTMSFVELNNDVMSEQEIEARRKFFSNPKNQAEILLNNYLKGQTILVNHSQRRALYAQFLRNAKKGKYKKIFAEYIDGVSKEKADERFSKLNG